MNEADGIKTSMNPDAVSGIQFSHVRSIRAQDRLHSFTDDFHINPRTQRHDDRAIRERVRADRCESENFRGWTDHRASRGERR